MSELEFRPKAEPRYFALVASFVVSVVMYRASQVHAFPDDVPRLLDLNEHGKHIVLGGSLGFGFRYVMENIKRAREWAFGIAVTATAVVGHVVETPWFQERWYRDTTMDHIDTLYTFIFGVGGALCLKKTVEIDFQEVIEEVSTAEPTNALETMEINPLQTD